MAKINFDVVLMNPMDGKVLKDSNEATLTLAKACRNALFMSDEKSIGEDKYTNYVLGMKVGEGGAVDLKTGEITTIKEAVGKYSGTIVVGPVWDFLEGNIPAGYEEKKN